MSEQRLVDLYGRVDVLSARVTELERVLHKTTVEIDRLNTIIATMSRRVSTIEMYNTTRIG